MHNNAHARLYFIDWVRILAFFVLIVYHTGMYYVSWDWHVKSPHAGTTAEPFMLLSSPWRLGLLFLISGVASSHMLAKLDAARFVRQRSVRLLVPLLFGMLVIVPPQSYLEVVEKTGYTGDYVQFMHLYLSGYGGFCRDGSCLIMPTWNHLWFIAYLWTYTLVLAAIVAAYRARFDAVASRLGRMLDGWKIIALPAAMLALMRLALAARFPQTHMLVNDWFSHATFLSLFLLGAALARQPAFWLRLGSQRWAGLGIALSCWCLLVLWYALPHHLMSATGHATGEILMGCVRALCAWSAIVAVCGFAQRYLQFDSAARRYLAEAVFPVYIVHQTLIVCLAVWMRPAGLAPGLEALLLVALTLSASFGVFEVVRRQPWLRPLFGLAPQPRPVNVTRPLVADAP